MWWVSRLVIHTGLPVGGGGVGAALVAGEVDERELAVHAVHAGGAHHYLEHGVRPRRVRVRRRLPHTDKHYNRQSQQLLMLHQLLYANILTMVEPVDILT